MIEIKITGGNAEEVFADMAKLLSAKPGAAAPAGSAGTPLKAKTTEKDPVKEVAAPESVTREMINKLAVEKAETKAPAVRALVAEFGAAKLSGLKPEDYPAFYLKLHKL